MLIRFKLLEPAAKTPAYAHPGDAGFDFFALERTMLKPGERTAVRTGVSLEIPEGHAGLIWDKSGIGIKNGLKTLGGVIDAGYRGEILIGMVNLSDKEYVFEAGHKVAQMLIQKIEQAELVPADNLSESERGHGRFGSTGL